MIPPWGDIGMTALDDWHKEHLSPTAIAMFEAWKEAEQAVPRDEAQCEHALRELLAQVIDDLMEAKGLHQRSSALGRAPREMGPYLPSGQGGLSRRSGLPFPLTLLKDSPRPKPESLRGVTNR